MMKKYVPLLSVSLLGGGLAFALRLLQNRTGFEPDTGLPIAGNPYAAALAAVLALAAALTLLLCRSLPGETEDTPLDFPHYFQARSLLSPMLTVAAAFLWLLSGGLELFSAFAYQQGLTPVLLSSGRMLSPPLVMLSGALTMLAALTLFPTVSACRTGGKRAVSAAEHRPLNSNLLLVPPAALVLRLVLVYRADSINPAVSAYYVELLALAALILSVYRASSFAFHCGRTRRFAVYSLWALTLNIATLADGHAPAALLLHLGGVLLAPGLLGMRLTALAQEAAKPEAD